MSTVVRSIAPVCLAVAGQAFLACAQVNQPLQPGVTMVERSDNTATLYGSPVHYGVYVPAGYDSTSSGKKWPCILVMPGEGQSWDGGASGGWNEEYYLRLGAYHSITGALMLDANNNTDPKNNPLIADRFMVIGISLPRYNDSTLLATSAESDIRTLAPAIDHILSLYNGDPLQTYLAGEDNGAALAFMMANQRPNVFAALLLINANGTWNGFSQPVNLRYACTVARIPTRIMNAADTNVWGGATVKRGQEVADAMNACPHSGGATVDPFSAGMVNGVGDKNCDDADVSCGAWLVKDNYDWLLTKTLTGVSVRYGAAPHAAAPMRSLSGARFTFDGRRLTTAAGTNVTFSKGVATLSRGE